MAPIVGYLRPHNHYLFPDLAAAPSQTWSPAVKAGNITENPSQVCNSADGVCHNSTGQNPSPQVDSMVSSGHTDASLALEGRLAQTTEETPDSDSIVRHEDLPTNQGNPITTAWVFQCPLGSHILTNAIKLPCGHCVCRTCLPTPYIRNGIDRTWPGLPERREGFRCPCCREEHAKGDCWPDYLSNKALWKTQSLVNKFRSLEGEDVQKLLAAFQAISLDATFSDNGVDSDIVIEGDEGNLGPVAKLERVLRREMDCAICHSLLYNPWTTPCGHTFCQQCITRSITVAPLCPTCRTTLSTRSADTRISPPNQFVVRLTTYFWSDDLAARKAAMNDESIYPPDGSGFDTPLFVCTVSFPRMPTFLHVFEQKYRNMMVRVWGEGRGTKHFGMVLPTRDNDIGWVGVHLRIDYFELYPDGRSVVESQGTSRFRVKRWDVHRDGYIVAEVEDFDDVSLHEEENLEAQEINNMPPGHTDFRLVTFEDLDHLSTRELMQLAYDIIQFISGNAPEWMNNRILALYGQCPNDPLLFPWWLGSIIPVHEHEKERLLMQTTVRARMKICCRWLLEWRTMRRSW